jgi:hypothetical protein
MDQLISVNFDRVTELVDLAPAIESSSYLYDEDYAARVRDVSVEIADLVRDSVS